MTPNETNLIKTFVELLEQKNEKIIELSIVEANKNTEEVKTNWFDRYADLEDTLKFKELQYNTLVEKLKKDGFIPEDVREELGIQTPDIPF